MEQHREFQFFHAGDAMHDEPFVAGRDCGRQVPEFSAIVGSLANIQQLRIAGFAVSPQHSLDADDVAPFLDLLLRKVHVVPFQGCGDRRIARALVIGLQHPEVDTHGPHRLNRFVAQNTCGRCVGQRVANPLLGFGDHLPITEQVTQAEQTVGVIGCLLVAPPVASVGFGVTSDLTRPKAGVVRIGHRLGMSRKSRLLAVEEFLDPALRLYAADHAALKLGIRGLGVRRGTDEAKCNN